MGGAITTTILGSIAWQLVASSFPIAFLSNPIVFCFLQAALFLEATGICAAAWFFAVLQRKAMGYQSDEVFVGTPEERAAKGHADDEHATDNFDMATYLPAHGVGTDDLATHFTPLGRMQATYSSRRETVVSMKMKSNPRDSMNPIKWMPLVKNRMMGMMIPKRIKRFTISFHRTFFPFPTSPSRHLETQQRTSFYHIVQYTNNTH